MKIPKVTISSRPPSAPAAEPNTEVTCPIEPPICAFSVASGSLPI